MSSLGIILGLLASWQTPAGAAKAYRPPPATGPAGAEPAQRPRHRRRKGPKDARIRKYGEPTKEEIARNRATAMGWYERARQEFAPALHLVETRHFLLFSAWDAKDDARLGEVCETMYAHLRRQLDLPAGQAVWAGKLPIFVFREKEHFRRFTNELDGQEMPEAGGYLCRRDDGFCHIVLNRVHNATYFYGLLVHEGTHAFLARYLTNASLPEWLNEGLAETMSAQLVPGCKAASRYVQATAMALRRREGDLLGIFRGVEVTSFDYGVAQSLVRFLIARDRQAFRRLIQLLKAGSDQAEALSQAYGLTQAELIAEWRAAARGALRRTG